MGRAFYFGKVAGTVTHKVSIRLYDRCSHLVLGLTILVLCFPLTVEAVGRPTLVQDLTPIPYQVGFDMPSAWYSPDWPNPNYYTMISNANGLLLFVGWDEINGAELWKSDGTTAGTILVKDIYPGANDSEPAEFTLVNGILFFAADDGSSGRELWKTDGTLSGTVQVKDILPGSQSSSLRNLTAVNDILFFSLDNGTAGNELWKSDGTTAGTVLVKAGFPSLAYGRNIADFTAVKERLYFTAADGNSGTELWTSDGSTTGTTLVKDISPDMQSTFPGNLMALNGMVFFTTYTGTAIELWKSDGTDLGTVSIQNFGSDFVDNLISINKTLFFTRRDNASDIVTLWKSDGTTIGTELVREFVKSTLYQFTAINSTLFFYLNNSSASPLQKNSLWKSDGTTAETVMVRDLEAYVNTSINVNGLLFFTTENSFWKSDGTTAGTIFVPKETYGSIEQLTGVNNTVFFKMCDTGKCALGKLNDSGYENLKSSVSAQGSSALKQLTMKSGELFFVKDIRSGTYGGRELWRSDGTTLGSKKLRTFADLSWSATVPFVIVKQKLFFGATDDEYSRQLWQSDGTSEGTTIFHDSWATALANIDGDLLFATRLTDQAGLELWRSKGTEDGTNRVKWFPCNESSCLGWIPHIIGTQNISFFTPTRYQIPYAYVYELWKTNQTEQGTVLIKRFGLTHSSPSHSTPATLDTLTLANRLLFFAARETGEINGLWRSDGTPEGTIALTPPGATADGAAAELTNVNGVLFFRIDDGINGTELWKSDGTVAGTVLVKDILPGPFGSVPTELTAVNGKLFFSANDGNSGRELWQSDGTTEGTVLVKEILPGPSGAVPQQLANVNDSLVFSASDGQHGVEAWWSDGTAAGTTLIQDIAPGMANANPDQFTFAGHQLFFTANDGLVGQELWSLRSFAENVDVAGGKLVSWLDHTTYQFPSGTFSTAVTVTHTLQDPAQLGAATPWRPVRAFELTVVDSETGASVQLEHPYSLAAQYTEAELGVLIDSTLALYAWDGQQWTREASSTVDLTNHLITATSTHTGLWAIGGETYQLFLPVAGK